MLPPHSAALVDSRVGFHIEGRGRPVVLLHSSMGSKGQWRSLGRTHAGRSHRLIAIDLHGYGAWPLPPPGQSFTLHHEVRLIDRVLQVALLPGENLSFGGPLVWRRGGVAARMLEAAPTAEPRAVRAGGGAPATARPTRPRRARSVRDELQRYADRGEALLGAQRFIDYWSGAGSFAQLPRSVQMNLAGLVPKTLLDFAAVSREPSSVDDYRCISAPVCLFSGTTGPRPPRDVLDVLANALPQARRHRVDAGHMAPVTHSWLVNPVLECFIRGVDSSDTPQPARFAVARRSAPPIHPAP